jgi:hypothetical protein
MTLGHHFVESCVTALETGDSAMFITLSANSFDIEIIAASAINPVFLKSRLRDR